MKIKVRENIGVRLQTINDQLLRQCAPNEHMLRLLFTAGAAGTRSLL